MRDITVTLGYMQSTLIVCNGAFIVGNFGLNVADSVEDSAYSFGIVYFFHRGQRQKEIV